VLPSVEQDQGFADRITVLAAPLTALRAQVVGETTVPLNGARADARTKETNLGNLISDAMLEKTRAAGAQLALMNGGSIRTSIDAGQITLGELLEVQPFGNTITLVTITGDQLRAALENGVSQLETVAGRFAQVAGIRYSFDATKPVGSRITAVEIADGQSYTPIKPDAAYRVVTNNFLLTGGDGYSVLQAGTNKIDTGLIDVDVTADYVRAHSPISPAVQGRILIGAPLPGSTAPSTPGTPATLPNTGGDLTPLWLLAALGASAVGAGARMRSRLRHAQPAATEVAMQETIEEQAEIVG
jgi:5'-nucleotidase